MEKIIIIVVIIILLAITAFYIYEVNKKVLYISHGKSKKGIITGISNSHVFIGGLRVKKHNFLLNYNYETKNPETSLQN